MFRKIVSFMKTQQFLYKSARNHQVTVLGGASEIGQSISLLLRGQPNITKLVIHDVQPETQGIILDLTHVPTNSTLKGFVGPETLEEALTDSEIVIGAGGMIHRPSLNNTMWMTNTTFLKTLANAVARLKQPMPFVGIVTEPLNSLVPMAAEIIRNHGEYDPKRLFGITNIDVMRAQALFAADHNLNPASVCIPVIGGHSDKTCIPLLSQAEPLINPDESKSRELTRKLRYVDTDIRQAKKGFAPVLSIAYSAFLFTRSVLDALDGKKATVNALVDNNDFGTEYFSGQVFLNEDGVEEMKRYTNLSKYECQLLESSIEQLRNDVLRGKKILQYA